MNSEKMKILLLSVNSNSFFYDQVVIPFGLISLGSYVENEDYEIKGIEMNTPPDKISKRYLKVDKDLIKEIKEFSPKIIAMSTYASNIYNVLFWAKTIKKELPNSFIVIGGNHASYIATECLKKCSGIDMIVRFEGEIPFKMICEKVKEKDYDFSSIPNITYRLNGKIKNNPQMDLIKDLSSLPNLNREFFKDGTAKREDIFHADIVSARGCPYNCTFCNCNHYWSKRYRVKLINSVINELNELQKRYPNLKSVRFRDESLTINKIRCKKLCEAIIENGIKLDFEAHSRLDGLDEEVIQWLSKAGFKRVYIGMESGSKAVLKRLQKEINISMASKIIYLLRKYGINFRISFMSSTPQEKFKETIETIKLIKTLKLKKDQFYLGSGIDIYPGTAECDKFLKLCPDYEWITKTYNFQGNYYELKDFEGNILNPRYKEYGLFKSSVIAFLLNPIEFLKLIINRIIEVFKKFI